MATTMKVGDPTYYQGKAGVVHALLSVLTDEGRRPACQMEYALPDDEAQDRPHVTLDIDPATGKPTGTKTERPWNTALDGERTARTTCLASDLRWDTGRKAWIVDGHGLKKHGGFWPDASHPENVHAERKEG